MTPYDVVRRVHPAASDAECDSLLWSCSSYPCTNDPDRIEAEIREDWEAGGRCVQGALDHAHAELKKAMEQTDETA